MTNVNKIVVFVNELCPDGCIRLYWDGDKGFGTYDLFIQNNEDDKDPQVTLVGDSEYMDLGEDKEFLKSLLESIVSHTKIGG